jgi:hypothetical protein
VNLIIHARFKITCITFSEYICVLYIYIYNPLDRDRTVSHILLITNSNSCITEYLNEMVSLH